MGHGTGLQRPVGRRSLLGGLGALLATTAIGPLRPELAAATQSPVVRPTRGTKLRILRWRHLLPSCDTWFDKFAQEWGQANGVGVTVGHASANDVPAAIAAENSAGQGHGPLEYNQPLSQYGKAVLDPTDVVQEASRRHGPWPVADGGWLDEDPFGLDPAGKRAPLKTAGDWTVNLGYPGPANPALGEIFNLPILPNMMARAARGEQTAAQSVAQADREVTSIFDKWRKEGLMGGGSARRSGQDNIPPLG
jgi:hypothetical protein